MNEFVDSKLLCCSGNTNFEPDSFSLGKWLGSKAILFLLRSLLIIFMWGVKLLLIGSLWVGHTDPSCNHEYLKWLIE